MEPKNAIFRPLSLTMSFLCNNQLFFILTLKRTKSISRYSTLSKFSNYIWFLWIFYIFWRYPLNILKMVCVHKVSFNVSTSSPELASLDAEHDVIEIKLWCNTLFHVKCSWPYTICRCMATYSCV